MTGSCKTCWTAVAPTAVAAVLAVGTVELAAAVVAGAVEVDVDVAASDAAVAVDVQAFADVAEARPMQTVFGSEHLYPWNISVDHRRSN